jgi:hypothetical protein
MSNISSSQPTQVPADSPVMRAYEQMLRFATTGRIYTYGEVFRGEEYSADTEVGTGYDFERTVRVMDRGRTSTVDGKVSFRILRLTHLDAAGTLFLRARLTWTTSKGEEHESFASYDLRDRTARALALQYATGAPELDAGQIISDYDEHPAEHDDSVSRLLTDAMEALNNARPYRADWHQGYPYSPEFMPEGYDFTDMLEYHGDAVIAVQQSEPVLCMLADLDLGAVHPNELVLLYTWLLQQPESSGKL